MPRLVLIRHGQSAWNLENRFTGWWDVDVTEKGYPKTPPGNANLSMSTNQLAERFGAVSMTLEMPFKDHDPNPDPDFGWSVERSKTLAHAMLEVLAEMIDEW